MVLLLISICIFLITKEVEHLFMFTHQPSLLLHEMPVCDLCTFFYGLFDFFSYWFRRAFYILWMLIISWLYVLQVFFSWFVHFCFGALLVFSKNIILNFYAIYFINIFKMNFAFSVCVLATWLISYWIKLAFQLLVLIHFNLF